jgi:hypothetical protein
MTGDSMPEVMDKRWPTHGHVRTVKTHLARNRRWSASVLLERTTGFEPATPTLAKVPGTGSVTCGDGRIWPVNKLFRSRATAMVRVASCSVTGPRRDPLRSPGYQRKQDETHAGLWLRLGDQGGSDADAA